METSNPAPIDEESEYTPVYIPPLRPFNNFKKPVNLADSFRRKAEKIYGLKQVSITDYDNNLLLIPNPDSDEITLNISYTEANNLEIELLRKKIKWLYEGLCKHFINPALLSNIEHPNANERSSKLKYEAIGYLIEIEKRTPDYFPYNIIPSVKNILTDGNWTTVTGILDLKKALRRLYDSFSR